jgi:hypothetical protein
VILPSCWKIVNPPVRYREGVFEPLFGQRAFRPLTDHATDISIFTRMLASRHARAAALVEGTLNHDLQKA